MSFAHCAMGHAVRQFRSTPSDRLIAAAPGSDRRTSPSCFQKSADEHGDGLDARRLFEVLALVRELRAAGQTHDLLNKVWRRLTDIAVLERRDLRESLVRMRRGDGIPTDISELETELGIAN